MSLTRSRQRCRGLVCSLAIVAALVLIIGHGGCGADPVIYGDSTPSGTVAGSVVDAELLTAGVPGTQLYIYVPEPPAARQSVATRQTGVAQGVSDADGSFEIPGVSPGCYMLRVTPPADCGYADAPAIHVDVTQDATTSIRVTLPTETTLAGIGSVTVLPANATVAPGGTQQYTATVLDTTGAPVSVTPVWCVDMEHAGTMSRDGLFTAGQGAGSGKVLAIVADTVSSADVTVAATSGG